MGPTASGKSALGIQVAEEIGARIVSADSMQVYRGMDIGTAKPTLEERARVRHYLIDLIEPEALFTVADYQRLGRAALAECSSDEVGVLIVGGSGLHVRSLLDPIEFPPHDVELRRRLESLDEEDVRDELVALDASAGDHVDLANPRRIIRALEIALLTGETPSERFEKSDGLRVYEPLHEVVMLGLDAGDRQPARVEARLTKMIEAGLLDEVENLEGRLGRTAGQAVGYRQLLPVVRGQSSLEEGIAAARKATLRLVRRQRTFFRRDPRITWVAWRDDPAERIRAVRATIQKQLAAWVGER